MAVRIPWCFGILCCILLMANHAASAKTVAMRPLSRSAVATACDRAGGAGFGFGDSGARYGCTTQSGSVVCEPDESDCTGYVSDLLPMPGSSINAILGAAAATGPTRLKPLDERVAP
jgi:hypothetical protein